MRLNRLLVVFIYFFLWAVGGCGGHKEQGVDSGPTEGRKVLINGAGASFPNPLYSRWIAEYSKLEKNVQINYQSIGSGAGIQQFLQKVIDFGGTDAPLSDEQLAMAPGEVLHVPMVMGAVAVTYNVPEINGRLRLSPDVLADIYLGKIKRWNDQRLKSINPEASLPDRAILVVHRSDGSGTTNIFTDYLSSISPEWKQRVGKGTAVEWPVGVGSKGNEGVCRQVQATEGSIGYVELAYVFLNKLPYALLKNGAGYFVEPSVEGIMAAAAGFAGIMPGDLRFSIVNAPGQKTYPIAGYTYILVYKEQSDPGVGRALVKFLWWAIHEGDQTAISLHYAPLPEEVKKKVEAKLKSVSYKGIPLLQQGCDKE
ncbi:MAG: phosphate ABC transporter substrate-binding protein PstS [Peptococcaceae bacterium]|nr:phosphate ABC transporter substrate-binding protein PstS [Peptococcaceae bacterium]